MSFTNKRIIFHHPLPLNFNAKTASGLRPVKMYEAFVAAGCKVDLVVGYGRERKRAIRSIKNNIKNGINYSFCYSESSTMPTLLTEKHHYPTFPFLDFQFFSFLQRNSIKIGLFYRDIHWQFPHYKGKSKLLKLISKVFYKYDLKKYKKCLNQLFLPSVEMKKYLGKFNCTISDLPPGCDDFEIKRSNTLDGNTLNLMYVGGIQPPLYDIKGLLKIVSKNTFLKIVCRKDEWEKNRKYYDLPSNVEILHLNAESLDSIYSSSNVFIIYLKDYEYFEFAMPYKFFETIGYELPMIVFSGTKMAEFVFENDIGWIVNNEFELKELLKSICLKPDLLVQKVNKIKNIKKYNVWEKRVEKVMQTLK